MCRFEDLITREIQNHPVLFETGECMVTIPELYALCYSVENDSPDPSIVEGRNIASRLMKLMEDGRP